MIDINYKCCFCGTIIKSTKIDPCDLNILINVDKAKNYQDNQTFYCHIDCFRNTLDNQIKNALIVDVVD